MMRRCIAVWLLCMSLAFRVSGAEPGEDMGQESGEVSDISVMDVTEDAVESDEADGELEGEFITSTVKDEINTVQINFHCIMPEGFNLGVCMEMLGSEKGNMYRILATDANGYLSRMYVAEDAYTILDCYVVGDNTAEYPMTIPSDFVAERGRTYLLECVMNNPEGAKSREQEEKALAVSDPSKEASGVDRAQEELSIVPYDEVLDLPWRNIRHQGEGSAELLVEGVSKQRVELVVEITASGGYKKGEFRYSTDKGETWSDTMVIGNTPVRVDNTADGEFTGLNLRFGNEEYLIYDVYALSTKIEYEQESIANNGKGIVNFFSDDVIYDDNYSIVLKVVNTGAVGAGEFQYSLNGGFLWSEDILIPAQGLFLIPDTGIRVEFFDNGGEFMVGDTYKTKIRGDMSKHDYTPVIAVSLVAAFLLMAGVYHHYASQRDRADQYELMIYERVK